MGISIELIFIINTFSTFFMTGLIWYVQLVHYPSFRFVSEDQFPDYHRHHSLFTGLIVMPVMITELVTSFLLFLEYPVLHPNSIGFYLVLLIWASTFFLSVPQHNVLRDGKNEASIQKLVRTNWFRTVFWTIKSGISIVLLTG